MYGLNFSNVYELCNKHRWFTQGTKEQYYKMFRMVDVEVPIEEIAAVIWLCSDVSEWSKEEILTELQTVAKKDLQN